MMAQAFGRDGFTAVDNVLDVGIAILLVGSVDVGWMVYCFIHKISYSSSLNLFGVAAGMFLMRQSSHCLLRRSRAGPAHWIFAVKPMPRPFGVGGFINSRMAERMAAMA
jgi:hypothetical protein